jgi:hypothetical protein
LWRDVVLFGQVLSAGLLVGGYVLGGACVAYWMKNRGFGPAPAAVACAAIALFGLWQGWLFLSHIGRTHFGKDDRKRRKERES